MPEVGKLETIDGVQYRVLTVAEWAREKGCSKQHVRGMCRDGTLNARRKTDKKEGHWEILMPQRETRETRETNFLQK